MNLLVKLPFMLLWYVYLIGENYQFYLVYGRLLVLHKQTNKMHLFKIFYYHSVITQNKQGLKRTLNKGTRQCNIFFFDTVMFVK